MRTRVIPAQITTVEDKIVGSLNFMQAGLLMLPILYATLAYIILPKTMSFPMYKLVSVIIVTIICTILSLRIKGMVVANWLLIITRFNSRPKLFVYNKNDIFLRSIFYPSIKKQDNDKLQKELVKPLTKKELKEVNFAEIIALDDLVLHYKIAKKGGLRVALKKT